MWRVVALQSFKRRGARWLTTLSGNSAAVLRRSEDEGDWSYSAEWWDTGSGSDEGHTVFRAVSEMGNGVVSVVAYPSSRPEPEQWPAVERWLQERYEKSHPTFTHTEQFKILGYQWRVLRFNDNTRQSTVKVMAASRSSNPGSLYLMQQPRCLAVPYIKSMFSAGFTTIASLNFDLSGAVAGNMPLNVLCIGHGGGSLPLFLASKIKGATVDIVEIDPIVIKASTQAMGFPASSAQEEIDKLSYHPDDIDQILWKDVSTRLFLYRSDAEDFIRQCSKTYDLVFIDAYDGDDIFPRKLWDPNSPFLKALQGCINQVHGTVVVNLHSDYEEVTVYDSLLPMGRYVSQVCNAYKKHMGMAFTVSVPWLCNRTLVACTGSGFARHRLFINRDQVFSVLISKANLVEYVLDLPFPCLQYLKNGFVLV